MNEIRPTSKGEFPSLLTEDDGVHSVALGNGTQWDVLVFQDLDNDQVVIGIFMHGCYAFRRWVHASYVAKKLGVGMGDAGNMADFINCQLGMFDESKTQGRYDADLITDIRSSYEMRYV